MTTPATPSNPTPAGGDSNPAAANVGFDQQLQGFWGRNRTLVIGLCVIVLVAIIAKGGLGYLGKQKDLDVQKAYAAATTPEQLQAFATAHSDHPLAGIASLRLADDAYTANKPAEAVTLYDKAIAVLKDGPLVARAKLGRTLAKAQTGNASEATAELKQISDDETQFNAVRAEALYHLASISASAGNASEVQSYAMKIMQLDPQSPWTMRAMGLQSRLPAPAAAAPGISVTPSTSAPAAPETKAGDAGAPKVEVKLPGK